MKNLSYVFCICVLIFGFIFSYFFSNKYSSKFFSLALSDVMQNKSYTVQNYSGPLSSTSLIVYSSLSCSHCANEFLRGYKLGDKRVYRFVYSNFFDVSATTLFLNLPDSEKFNFVFYVYKNQNLLLESFKSFLLKVNPSCWTSLDRCSVYLTQKDSFDFWSHQNLPFSLKIDEFKMLDKSFINSLFGPQEKLFSAIPIKGTPFIVKNPYSDLNH